MAKKPMIGATGLPMFGVGRKPLFEEDDCCCEDPCLNVDIVAEFTTSYDDEAECIIQFHDLSVADNPIVAWAWTFGDGGTSTLQNPTHDYASTSTTYTVTLTVTDDEGCHDSVSHQVNCERSCCGGELLIGNIIVTFTGSFEFMDCVCTVIRDRTHTLSPALSSGTCGALKAFIVTDAMCPPLAPDIRYNITVLLTIAGDGGTDITGTITWNNPSSGAAIDVFVLHLNPGESCHGTHALPWDHAELILNAPWCGDNTLESITMIVTIP